MNDCEACLRDEHSDCDTTAWTDLGMPTHCGCWARGHPNYTGLWDPSQVHNPDDDFQPTWEQEEENRRP